ncbi:MAG: hypothetical protein ACXWDM_08645 [Nocardioides sp.]
MVTPSAIFHHAPGRRAEQGWAVRRGTRLLLAFPLSRVLACGTLPEMTPPSPTFVDDRLAHGAVHDPDGLQGLGLV